MYQAFCEQKGKVPYIPKSWLHTPVDSNQKHSIYRSIGTSVGETRYQSARWIEVARGSFCFLVPFFFSPPFFVSFFLLSFFLFYVLIACFKQKALK